ncbi:hypothetical protein EUX98_g7701 [Antrodiella citrinella]|uniref:Uncharacterized protein n=1 Tax=Antrodiella citrinella TaxID=2447956 RepID=A0A4S4MMJ7_9APHY|nr:hypothetical protein EUX98_g7701 [Antrodiella citrinella]
MSTSYQQNRPHPVPLPAFQPDYSGPVLLDALHCPLTVADNHCVLNSNAAYPHDEPDVGRRDHDDCEYDHSHTTQHSSSGGVSNPAWDGPSFARVHHVQDTNTYNRAASRPYLTFHWSLYRSYTNLLYSRAPRAQLQTGMFSLIIKINITTPQSPLVARWTYILRPSTRSYNNIKYGNTGLPFPVPLPLQSTEEAGTRTFMAFF